jgi:hypothetical protein
MLRASVVISARRQMTNTTRRPSAASKAKLNCLHHRTLLYKQRDIVDRGILFYYHLN